MVANDIVNPVSTRNYKKADGTTDWDAFYAARNASPRYILDKNGVMVTNGWYQITSTQAGYTSSNVWCYANADGTGYDGWLQYNGSWYYIKDGVMLINQYTPDGYFVGMDNNISNMNHLPYRAIALDLDGTLTNHDKVVTPKTREALLQAEAEGVVIILASGRPTYGIEPVAECLELDKRGGYILSYNGGNIVNAKTGEKLFAQFLPDEVIPILYRYAKEKNHALLGYAGNEIITEMPDDQYVKEESRINKMNIRKVENLFEALEPHPTKLLMTGDPADMLKAENELSEILGDRMDIFRSAPFFLELVPKGIDKAKSLLRLLSKINLTPADMIAFGDGYNDLSMLKLAGMGVAMQNAAPEVRAEADYITLSNEEDGVAAALEHFCKKDF